MPALGGATTQVPACTGVELVKVWQSVRWKPLPALAGVGVHEATLVGPLTNVSAGQVVVVQPLPALGPEGVHEATAALVVLLVEHVVVVQLLPDVGPEPVHDATGVGPLEAVGQVVVV